MNKIMHIFGSMDYGGAEISTISVMDKLKYEFEDVYFLTTSGKKGGLATSLESKGYIIIPCSIYSLKFPLLFYQILKKNKISIIHSHISFTSGYIMLISFMAGVSRRITHFRSTKNSSSKNILHILKALCLKLLVYFFSTDIVAVNESTMKTHFKNHNKISRCQIIYNGKESLYQDINKNHSVLDINKFNKVIIHIGRFHESKNHLKIINVFQEFINIEPNSVLLLIGKNDTEIGEEIKETINRFGLNKNIALLGIKKNIGDYLTLADAMIFPSKWEGLPGVVLESLSAGIPVICSDIAPHQEISKTNLGITLLSNDIHDKIWAEKLYEITRNGKSQAIAEDFKNSPYFVDNALIKFRKLYLNDDEAK